MSQPDPPSTPVTGEVTGPQRVTAPDLRETRRVGRMWRARAVHIVRGVAPPNMALGLRSGGDDGVSQRHARSVIDLALRVGEAMLSTGASAADCVTNLLRLMHAYGVRSAHVDITFTSIAISIHRGLDEDPLSMMRVIPGRAPDYTRLEAVQRIVDEAVLAAESGRDLRDIDDARRDLTEALRAPHPYRRWVVTLGAALLATGVVMLFGAKPGMWLVAAVSAAVVDRVQRFMYGVRLAAFFAQVVSAAVPALFALALYALAQAGVDIPGVRSPSLVVISGIVMLLAGLSVMGAAQDALDGYYVTAGARGMEVIMMTVGIAVGVALVIGTANRLGVSMDVSPFVVIGGTPVQSTIGAVTIALGFCLGTYTGRRTTLVAMLVAALGWLVFELGLGLGLGPVASTALASAPVGALAYAAHRRLRVPELAVGTAGIVSFLPGLAVYRAIFLMQENTPGVVGNAVTHFVVAVSTGVALAAGLSIGGYLARRRLGLDRAAQLARRRSESRYVAG